MGTVTNLAEARHARAKVWTTYDNMPGIRSKVRKRDGMTVFYADVYYHGKRHPEKVGSTKARPGTAGFEKAVQKARDMQAGFRKQVDAGDYQPPQLRKQLARVKASQRISWTTLRQKWLDYHRSKGTKCVPLYRVVSRGLVKRGLLKGDVRGLTRAAIERYRVKRLEAVAPRTVNGEMRIARALCSFAVELGYLEKNPASGVNMEAAERAGRYYTADEKRRIVAAARKHEPDLSPAVEFNMYAGLRAKELGELDWCNVDLDRRTVEVVGSKNRTSNRTLPLCADALAVLEALPHREGPVFLYSGKPLVVGGKKGGVTRRYLLPFQRVLQAAKVNGGRFYDTRHTWASDYIMRGGNLFALCYLGGWTDLDMVKRVYGHLAPGFLGGAVACLDGLLDSGTRSGTQATVGHDGLE